MRTTLKQVSEETGLSIATVSRALRRKNRNYTPNEEKIYKSARKLGYPFIGNSNISETSSIALVSEIKEGEFYSSLFYGFYASSRKSTSEIVFINTGNEITDPVSYIVSLSKKYSGICLFLPSLKKDFYKDIKEGVGDYPIISLIPGKNIKIDTVSFDSYSGGYMAAKHFQELGYKKTGIITGPKYAVDASFRKNGFIDHINENKDIDLAWTYEGDFTSSSGISAFKDFMKKDLKNIAIFGSNDHMCFGFMKAASENNFQIPNDFIIAGYDNLSFCKSITPELTSVATDFEALGSAAIRKIENMINNKSDIVGQFSMLPVKIKIRKSTHLS